MWLKPIHVLTAKLSLIELVAWGVLYYSFSVFLPAMTDDLGWSSATLAAGFSLALLVAGFAAPFVGAWIDRHGSRGLMVTGGLIGSLGLATWSAAHTFLVYFVGWALIGAGMAGTLYAPAFATVVRVQPERSRNAILIITLVGALASTLSMPLASGLAAELGWRGALLALAAMMAIVVTSLALSLPRATATPDPCADPGTAGEEPKAPGGFLLLAVSLMIADAASVAVHVHLVLFLVEQGGSLPAAASLAGLAGAAKIGGRLLTAAGARISATALLRASLLLTAATLILPVLWPSTTWAAAMMVLGFGATSGARTLLRPAIVVERYGSRDFGKSNGLLQLCTTIAKAVGPVGFGLVLRAAGWSWTWLILAALFLLSSILLLAMRPSANRVFAAVGRPLPST